MNSATGPCTSSLLGRNWNQLYQLQQSCVPKSAPRTRKNHSLFVQNQTGLRRGSWRGLTTNRILVSQWQKVNVTVKRYLLVGIFLLNYIMISIWYRMLKSVLESVTLVRKKIAKLTLWILMVLRWKSISCPKRRKDGKKLLETKKIKQEFYYQMYHSGIFDLDAGNCENCAYTTLHWKCNTSVSFHDYSLMLVDNTWYEQNSYRLMIS